MDRIIWLGRHLASGAGVVLLLGLALAIPAAAKQPPEDASSNGCAGSVPAGWVVLPGHIPPLLAQAKLLHPTDPARQLQLSISFALRNQAALDELLREQQDPNSPNYHKYLTPQEFQVRFGPTPAMIAQVQQFLTAQGLQVQPTVGQVMSASGTVKQVECAFAVKINDYQFGNRTIYAAANDPAVPANIAPDIQAILGLNNLAIARPIGPPRTQP